MLKIEFTTNMSLPSRTITVNRTTDGNATNEIILLYYCCCLLYICVTTILKVTLMFVFHIPYYMFWPHVAINRCIHSCWSHCISMLHINALLLLILKFLKSLEVRKTAHSAMLHLVVRCSHFLQYEIIIHMLIIIQGDSGGVIATYRARFWWHFEQNVSYKPGSYTPYLQSYVHIWIFF
jgi:hypothetical protein